MGGPLSRARTPRHALLAVLCSAALLFGIALGTAAPAVADTARGTISGTLTVAGEVPKEWGYVEVMRYDDARDQYFEVRSARMDPVDGSYSLQVAPGTYRLHFVALWAVGEYFPDQSRVWTADDVVVAPDGTVSASADLAARTGIYGTLADPVSGRVGYSARVVAVNTATHLHATAERLSDGSYFVGGRRTGIRGGIPTGTYRLDLNHVSGHSSYVAQYFPEVPESDGPGAAATIDYTVGDVVTGKDATVHAGSTLAGQLTTSSGVGVRCQLSAQRVGPDSYVTRTARSTYAGKFSITGLNPGDYRLTATRCYLGDAYDTTFSYDGDATLTADPATAVITVGVDQTLTLPDTLVLPVDGSTSGTYVQVSGHVARPAGSGQVTVQMYRVLDGGGYDYAGGTRVGSSGNYGLDVLAGGTYVVAFQRLTAQTLLAAQVYDGKADAAGLDGGTRVPVADQDVQLTDATLVAGGHLTGQLTSSGSVPLANCRVYAAPVVTGMAGRSAVSADDGSFDIAGLSTGDYQLRVAPGGGCSRSWEYYDGDGTLTRKHGHATAIPAIIGQTVALGGLVETLGGSISGHVTLPADANGRDHTVQLINLATGRVIRWTQVADDASYSFNRIGPGSYAVAFARVSGTTLAAQYWHRRDESVGLGGADPIALAMSQDVTGVDAMLTAGATLSGTVTNSAGTPLAGCRVRAMDPAGVLHGTHARTDDTGAFALTGLSTGAFRIVVSGGATTCPRAGDQWLQSTDGTLGSFATAIAEPVTAGQADALPTALVYADAATITGAIKIADDLPTNHCWSCYVFSAHLSVIDTATGRVVARRFYDKLDDDGRTFTVTGLAPGSYRLDFNRSSESSWLAPAYFANVPEPAGADAAQVVTVAAGATFHGGTQTMQVGGTIKGHVVDANGDPLDCMVVAFAADGSLSSRTAYSNLRHYPGLFEDHGLATAGYDLGVRCYTDAGYYGWMYYTGPSGQLTTDVTRAMPISSTLGQTVTLANPLVYAPNATPVIANTVAPVVSGTARVGAVLTADAGSWLPSPDGVSYQWLRNGTPIDGATASTYTVVSADLGATIGVQVTAHKAGYDDAAMSSAPTGTVVAGSLTATAAPGITGTARVGATLTGSTGTWAPAPDGFAYRWLADGTAIAGATGTTYVPTAAEAGKAITFEVTASKVGFTDAVATSAATSAVAEGTITNTVLPKVTGTAKVGSTLTASSGTWSVTGLTLAHQWTRDGSPIAGATGATYVLKAADAGTSVAVRVTASRTGYASSTATSAAVTVAKLPSRTRVGGPKTPKAGHKVSFTVTVGGTGVVNPTGRIVIKDGSRKVATLTLTAAKHGKVVVSLAFKKGRHKLTASYLGNGHVAASKSSALAVTAG
ncbi:carboxypeptidase regulatory-like domain-containing protein [Nocardioides ultimimeridianus]